MLSSTSSSDALTDPAWGRTWVAGLLLAVLMLVGLEGVWRMHRHVPSVVDDLDLWSYWREQAADGRSDTVVLLSNSRMNTAFNGPTWRHRFPDRKVVNLSVGGAQPLATLDDLSHDDQFRGIAILGVVSLSLRPRNRDAQREYVNYYHAQWSLDRKYNRLMRGWLQSHLVLIHPEVGLQVTIGGLLRRHLPKARYIVTSFDRTRAVDYHRIDVEKERARRLGLLEREEIGGSDPLTSEEWAGAMRDVEGMVERIQHRGGRVIFVHMPSNGTYAERLEAYAPRRQYWDVFAAATTAVTLHADDVPALASIPLPDGVHVDFRDTPRFTDALADALEQRGALRSGPLPARAEEIPARPAAHTAPAGVVPAGAS